MDLRRRKSAARGKLRGLALAAVLLAGPLPARADLKLCNRLSYVVETAIGIEDRGAVATRGWFRIDPGQCRAVLQGAMQGDLYVHARALPLYGASPLPQTGHADLCIAPGNFVISAARNCRSNQRLARFTAVKPAETAVGLVAILAEEAEYDDAQARLAGTQRLLVLAGYDANPIDGLAGPKTDAALAQFLKERDLPSDTATSPRFFDVLIDAVQRPAMSGFSWCNDTSHAVMAALGVEEKGGIVTHGWYRIDPGKCLRPEIRSAARRVFSFGEAVDADGLPLRRGDRPLAWGGEHGLCTREAKFELAEHKDCAANGLTTTGFAAVDLFAKGGTTVRFKE
jgi:uncharacterized membrane protein